MKPNRELSLFDSICIIVGIIVGAGIFETPTIVAGSVGSIPFLFGIWIIGGLLSLLGALSYAELASAYPQEGGDYIYLTRAYGRRVGFLFGWSQLAIVRPGDIAIMAFIFGRYAQTLYAPFPNAGKLYAIAAVVVLTALNVIGVRAGKRTQNLLTAIKALGLLTIVVVGFMAPGVEAAPAASTPPGVDAIALALILVMFTFGGWNETAYVSAEIKQPERNITRALVLGTVSVTVLYVLINAAYLKALGLPGMAGAKAVAVETLAWYLPDAATRVVAAIICISALGAVNGLVFTGARISYALGRDHRIFSRLGEWNAARRVPVCALIVQGALSVIIIAVVGSFVDTVLYTAPVVWMFFLATGLSVFVLRRTEPGVPRPFRIPGYPIMPALFCACAVYITYSSIAYAFKEKPVILAVAGFMLLTGSVLFTLTSRLPKAVRSIEPSSPGSGACLPLKDRQG